MGGMEVTDRRAAMAELRAAIRAIADTEPALFEALMRYTKVLHFEQMGSFLRKRKEAS